MRRRRLVPVVADRAGFVGYRFPPEVIMLAVRWYLRFGLTYRDLEELLAERGIEVDHVTLYRWVQHVTLHCCVGSKWDCSNTASGIWRVDESRDAFYFAPPGRLSLAAPDDLLPRVALMQQCRSETPRGPTASLPSGHPPVAGRALATVTRSRSALPSLVPRRLRHDAAPVGRQPATGSGVAAIAVNLVPFPTNEPTNGAPPKQNKPPSLPRSQ